MWCLIPTAHSTCLNHKQAYNPSLSGASGCRIARVGNQSLYFWTYAYNNYLYVSGWRSLNPKDASNLAGVGTVAQGHPVLEILAMIFLSETPQQMDGWIAKNRKTFREQPSTSVASHVLTVGAEFWRMIVEIFTRWKLPRILKLEEREFTGFLTTYVSISVTLFFRYLADSGIRDDELLRKRINSKAPWSHCLKVGRVWTDKDWVVKVAPLKEIQAMVEVGESNNVAELSGTMTFSSGPYHGYNVLFTRHYGEAVNDIRTNDTVAYVLLLFGRNIETEVGLVWQ